MTDLHRCSCGEGADFICDICKNYKCEDCMAIIEEDGTWICGKCVTDYNRKEDEYGK